MFVAAFFCLVLERHCTGYRILRWLILFHWGLGWRCSTICSTFSTEVCCHPYFAPTVWIFSFTFWLLLDFVFITAFEQFDGGALWCVFFIFLLLWLPWAYWICMFSSSMINIWPLFLPVFFCPTPLPPSDTLIKHIKQLAAFSIFTDTLFIFKLMFFYVSIQIISMVLSPSLLIISPAISNPSSIINTEFFISGTRVFISRSLVGIVF